jgi:hypothetical protein
LRGGVDSSSVLVVTAVTVGDAAVLLLLLLLLLLGCEFRNAHALRPLNKSIRNITNNNRGTTLGPNLVAFASEIGS